MEAAQNGQSGSCKNSTVPWWIRFSRWTQQSSSEGVLAEASLMALNKFPLQKVDVPVGPDRESFVHTLLGGANDKPPLVIAPGYAAGLGFYWRNFDALGAHFRLMAFDWLGTGLSGRPSFKAKGRQDAEDFFLESMEQWRIQMGLDKFILLGHSLGGYLSACYALKYPQHVEHLILVCPAGVPQAPQGWEKGLLAGASGIGRALFKTVTWAWEKGVTPGSFVRGIGPLGPGLINKYVTNRFSSHGQPLDEKETDVFKRYMYQILAAPGSGEHALRHLLAPGAWAYAPLEKRLHELRMPVTFIYGSEDWMRPEYAVKLCKQLRTERKPQVDSDLKVEIIRDAGHFVFIEQPELFNRAVLDACASFFGPAGTKMAAAGMPHAQEMKHSAEAAEWSYKS